MLFYLQICCSSLKDRLTIQSISNSFNQIWTEKLQYKQKNYFNIQKINFSQLPDINKKFLLSFIGYRNFSYGFPTVFLNIINQYFDGLIKLDLTILLLIQHCANENHFNAFLSMLRILFPLNDCSSNLDEDEFLFTIIYNYHIPEVIMNVTFEKIMQNCIIYSKKEFDFEIAEKVEDLFLNGSPLPENIEKMNLFTNPQNQIVQINQFTETDNSKSSFFELLDTCKNDFERNLIQSIIENDANSFKKTLQTYADAKVNEFLESQQELIASCENTFSENSSITSSDEIKESNQETDMQDSILDHSSLKIQQYENDESDETENMEEDDDEDEFFGEEKEEFLDSEEKKEMLKLSIEKANNLLFKLPSLEKIKYHIECLLSLLPNEESDTNIEEILEPLKIHMKIDQPRFHNMLGCRQFQWQKATKNLNLQIARLQKKNI